MAFFPKKVQSEAERVMSSMGFPAEPEEESVEGLVGQEPTSDFVEEVQESYEESAEQQEQEIAAEMSEVEYRLEKAQLYKQFVTGKIFDGVGQVVQEVTTEFRDFARNQLQVLMGVGAKKEPGVFAEDEIKVLKLFAERLLAGPEVLSSKPVQEEKPKLVVTKKEPVEAPVAAKPAPKPVLRVTKVPEEVEQPKPVKVEAVRSAKTVVKPTVASKAPAVATSKKIPNDGDIISEGVGATLKEFRVKYKTLDNAEGMGTQFTPILQNMKEGQVIRLKNGCEVLCKGGGYHLLIKTRVMKDIPVPTRIPFPSNERMAGVLAGIAGAQASKLPDSNNPY